MKYSHAPLALLLLLTTPPSANCSDLRPANFRELIPQSPEELNAMARESERTITVTVDAERRVFFRKEQIGTCDDVGPLKERVRKAIERNKQAARDRGDEELAKGGSTVFICAASDLKYRDIVKVVDAIKEAGGDPVGLQTDCPPQK